MKRDFIHMGEDINLRSVETTDMEFLFQLYATTRSEELAVLPLSEPQKEIFLAQQFDSQHRSYQEGYPDADFMIVEVAGGPAGRLYVDRGDEEIRIIDISLLPEFRRRGIGGAIFREILAGAGDRIVVLHVLRSNPAIRLYERLGFVVVEDVDPFLQMQWRASSSTDRPHTDR